MGLNFVIGCHFCKERVWMYRKKEAVPMHSFYQAHWKHAREGHVEVSDDQSDRRWVDEYEDVGERHGVSHERPYGGNLLRAYPE